MIHQVLLRLATRNSHPVLQRFVESIAPYMMGEFAARPALGGSGQPVGLMDETLPPEVVFYTDKEREIFSVKNADQSLAAHILNGLFAGMTLAQRLPEDRTLTDEELRVWILGFIVHDYTKVYGIKIKAGYLPSIHTLIQRLGERLHFAEFMADWQLYLDDITFIAQNTQKKEGAHLNLRDFTDLRIRPRRLEIIRELASFADILVHITSPAEVARPNAQGRDRSRNLTSTLSFLFGADRAPHLAYHHLAEVRGILTNLLNNALMQAFSQHGYTPYLFFPDGVVYLAEPQQRIQLNVVDVVKAVWERILEIVSADEAFGVRRGTTGFVASSALYELTGLTGVLTAGQRSARRIQNAKAATRLYGYFTGQSENDLKTRLGGDDERVKSECEALAQAQGLPFDVRVDRLAEYLTLIQRVVRDNFKRAPDVTPLILDHLRLAGVVAPEEALRNKGGTMFGWFYVAARFLASRPGLDDTEMLLLMEQLGETVQAWIEAQGLIGGGRGDLEAAVSGYLQRQVEVDGRRLTSDEATGKANGFADELVHYETRKSQRQVSCSLCSTPYPGVRQEDAEVPFKPQQYSNKNPLATSLVLRGICPICRIEMILRRIQQPGLKADDYPVSLYLYPTYFFTLETARVVYHFINRLQDLNLMRLIFSHLERTGFTVENIATYDEFMAEPDQIPRNLTIRKPPYSEEEPATLFFFSPRPMGKDPKETDAWIIPTFYTLVLPLMLNCKVVATASFVPLYANGAEFRETAILDAPHGFTRHALGVSHFRVDELPMFILRLLRLYELHLDVFGERESFHWPLINTVIKDVVTDPYYVFSYYERKERKPDKKTSDKSAGGIPAYDVARYIAIYHMLGGEPNMGLIGDLVDSYAIFYRAARGKLDSAYAVLKPLSEAIDVVVESDPRTLDDDLVLLVAGAISDLMNRVRDDQAEGWDPIVMVKGSPLLRDERLALSRQKQAEFAALLIQRLFIEYCNGDRALLRERTNRLRSAARFYYLSKYGYSSKMTEETDGSFS